jgi:hypothetical protein
MIKIFEEQYAANPLRIPNIAAVDVEDIRRKGRQVISNPRSGDRHFTCQSSVVLQLFKVEYAPVSVDGSVHGEYGWLANNWLSPEASALWNYIEGLGEAAAAANRLATANGAHGRDLPKEHK